MNNNKSDALPIDPNITTVALEAGIQRGEHLITSIDLRKPKTGALRGLALSDILRLDTITLLTLLPRITVPAVTKQELDQLDVADMTKLGTAVLGFFVKIDQEMDLS